MSILFFFNDTPTTEIYTLSLHDALPISRRLGPQVAPAIHQIYEDNQSRDGTDRDAVKQDLRSEEHTSELQSHSDLVCRLLLEKKKKKKQMIQEQQYKHQIATE